MASHIFGKLDRAQQFTNWFTWMSKYIFGVRMSVSVLHIFLHKSINCMNLVHTYVCMHLCLSLTFRVACFQSKENDISSWTRKKNKKVSRLHWARTLNKIYMYIHQCTIFPREKKIKMKKAFLYKKWIEFIFCWNWTSCSTFANL